ncbi:M20/M25/M40 family metallo-hydrolase [bacterium]|nr:M20/M25/M40 family metallo-hydrolase [bacterium]
MDATAKQFLIDLVNHPAPTGFEAPAVKVWCDYLRPHADEVFTDSYGNGFAVLNPKGDPTVLLTGHADEIGLMVTYIDDEGFLWVGSLGGYDAKILPAMRVRVFGRGGELPGVIGALPPHMQRPDGGGNQLERYKFGVNVYIDIGAKDKKEAEKYVRVGDPVILDYGFLSLKNDIAVSRGLDNKIGIWAAAEGLRRCSQDRKGLNAKIVALATVQEEIGGHGAKMGAFRIDPDVALAVDVTQSVDHPGAEKKRWGEHRMGQGPVVAHGSACHPEVVARLGKVARRLRINLQHEAAPMWTGTDGDSIFRSRAGIPTAVVSLAQRYMHSPVEMVNLKDLEQIASLLAAFCRDVKKAERFKVQV